MPRVPDFSPSPISARVPGAQLNVGAATRSAQALSELAGVGSNIAQDLLERRKDAEMKTVGNAKLKDYLLESQRTQRELQAKTENGKLPDGTDYFEAYQNWEKEYLDNAAASAPSSRAKDYFRQIVEPYSRRNTLASDVFQFSNRQQYQVTQFKRSRDKSGRLILEYTPINGVSRSEEAIELLNRDKAETWSDKGNTLSPAEKAEMDKYGGSVLANATLNAMIRDEEFDQAADVLNFAQIIKSEEGKRILQEEGLDGDKQLFDRIQGRSIDAHAGPHPLEEHLTPPEKAKYMRELLRAYKQADSKNNRVMLDRQAAVKRGLLKDPNNAQMSQSMDELQRWAATSSLAPSQKANFAYEMSVAQETGRVLGNIHSLHPSRALPMIANLSNTLEKGLTGKLKEKLKADPAAVEYLNLPEFQHNAFAENVTNMVQSQYSALRRELHEDGAAYGIAHNPRLAKMYRNWERTGNPADLASFQVEVETYQKDIGQIPGKMRIMPKAWMQAQGANLQAALTAKDNGGALSDWMVAMEKTLAANSKMSDRMFDLMVEEGYMPADLAYARLLPIEGKARQQAFSNIRNADGIKQAVGIDMGILRDDIFQSPAIGNLRSALLAGNDGKNLAIFNGIVDTLTSEYARQLGATMGTEKTSEIKRLGHRDAVRDKVIKEMWGDHNHVLAEEGLAYVNIPLETLRKHGITPQQIAPIAKVAKKRLSELDLVIEPAEQKNYQTLGYKTPEAQQERFKKETLPNAVMQNVGSGTYRFVDQRTLAPITPVDRSKATFSLEDFANDMDVLKQQKEDSKSFFEKWIRTE